MPPPGAEVQRDAAAEAARHDIIHDMQAEARAALVAPGGEERIEGAPLHVVGHAGAVVARTGSRPDAVADALGLDRMVPLRPVREAMVAR